MTGVFECQNATKIVVFERFLERLRSNRNTLSTPLYRQEQDCCRHAPVAAVQHPNRAGFALGDKSVSRDVQGAQMLASTSNFKFSKMTLIRLHIDEKRKPALHFSVQIQRTCFFFSCSQDCCCKTPCCCRYRATEAFVRTYALINEMLMLVAQSSDPVCLFCDSNI